LPELAKPPKPDKSRIILDYRLFEYNFGFKHGTLTLPKSFNGRKLIEAVQPLLGIPTESVGHEYVWFREGASSMFFDMHGQQRELPRNVAATDLLRRGHQFLHPAVDPETLPIIHGNAVLIVNEIQWG
jgi:hypothetical protein